MIRGICVIRDKDCHGQTLAAAVRGARAGGPWLRALLAAESLAWSVAGAGEGDAPARLSEVVVRAFPVASVVRPASMSDALTQLPAADLHAQGWNAQQDLNLRGSSFSGAGLSVAGLALRSPQTEHFAAELPLSPTLFQPPRLLVGADQIEESTGHLTGSVGMEFAPVTPGSALRLGGGEPHRDWQQGSTAFLLPKAPASPVQWGMNIFGGRENRQGDPAAYPDNFLEHWNGGLRLQALTAETQADLAAGRQSKEFGAQGFYGTPPAFPAVERLRQWVVAGSLKHETGPDSFARLSAVWQWFDDRYRLDRDAPDLYENRHRSDFGALSLSGVQETGRAWRLHWRGAVERERIRSTHSGTIPGAGLGTHSRSRLEALLMPEFRSGPWRAAGGLNVIGFSHDSPAVLPVILLGSKLTAAQDISLEYARSVRQPSYTELSYDSPGSLGNRGLERQQAAEIACIYHCTGERGSLTLTLYRRQERHTVDWIRTAPGARWEATDLGRVVVTGGEAEARLKVSDRFTVDLFYSRISKRSDLEPVASRYVLDYPRDRWRVGLHWELRPWCEFVLQQDLRRQVRNPARQSGEIGVNGRVQLRVRLPRAHGVNLVFQVDNPWSSDFESLPGLPSAGRRAGLFLDAQF